MQPTVQHRLRALVLVCFACVSSVLSKPALSFAQDAAPAPERTAVYLDLPGGSVVAGVVLAPDGLIVAPLGVLAGQTSVRVHYGDATGPDGSATRVGFDAAWGLALFAPRGGRWGAGASVAASARTNEPVQWFRDPNDAPVHARLDRRRTFVADDGGLLRDAWQLAPVPASTDIGRGVFDAHGGLVTVVVPAVGTPARGGSPGPFGVPAGAVTALVARVGPVVSPWIGFQARATNAAEIARRDVARGLVVIDVTPDGPAARAGLRANADVILWAAGETLSVPGDLGRVLEGRHPGDAIELHVWRRGGVRRVNVVLGTLPRIVPEP